MLNCTISQLIVLCVGILSVSILGISDDGFS